MKIYASDFETTTLETCSTETWVWAWGVRELYNTKQNNFKFGHDINGFMAWCEQSTKLVYFHNLKFDGFFILDWLLRNGFKHNTARAHIEKQFKTVITKDGLFYEIDVCFKRTGRKVKHVTFRDSLKKLPFTIDRIAKAFNLEMKKGSIDYKKVRPKGYLMDFEELEYLYNDVEILAKALEIQYEQGLERMTIGSDSLNTFKQIIGKREFERLFPILSSDVNADIRKAYKGGYTYLNTLYNETDVGLGQVYDVNSLYPATMYDKPMPYGIPIRYKGQYEHSDLYPLYIQKLTCEFRLKDGYIPTIQVKNDLRFKANEYLKDSGDHPVQLTLTSNDLELFLEHYDVYVYSWDGGYKFRSITGLFKEYIDKFMAIKETSTGALRELAKLLLNNLYGKFATSTDATNKVISHEDFDKLDYVKLVQGEYEEKDSVYTAVGAYITAYAREITIRSAQSLGDRFIYADTDSLHIRGIEPVPLDIHPTHLGKWKFEGHFKRARFIRAKTYIEDICIDHKGKETTVDKGVTIKTKVTCAGMSDRIKKQVTFDNFKRGSSFTGKLTPKVIKGGVVLEEIDFTIKMH